MPSTVDRPNQTRNPNPVTSRHWHCRSLLPRVPMLQTVQPISFLCIFFHVELIVARLAHPQGVANPTSNKTAAIPNPLFAPSAQYKASGSLPHSENLTAASVRDLIEIKKPFAGSPSPHLSQRMIEDVSIMFEADWEYPVECLVPLRG